MELVKTGAALASSRGRVAPVPATGRTAVVDSDAAFGRVLVKRLSAAGRPAEVLASAPPVEELAAGRHDAVVIDPVLLGRDAWSYLQRLCGGPAAQAVIVCTGSSSVAQRVRGLRLGVDDWVTKPCHPEEVLARVEAVVRRRTATRAGAPSREPIVAGEVEIRPDMFDAYVGGRALGLTQREFGLLELLASSSGRPVPRNEIYERAWGYSMVRGDRSVDVFVRKLRRKLEAASPGWRYLHTHFGIGYRFDPEEVEVDTPPDEPAGLPPA